MCRLLLVLNKPTDPIVERVLQLHMHDLEDAMGGDGNGIWMPTAEPDKQFIKSFNMSKLWQGMQEPFMFHTRRATGHNVTEENCHPFDYKNAVLMHNGVASAYTTPATRADTFNLLKSWQDSGKRLTDMSWSGNIIAYDKARTKIDIIIKNNLERVTLKDGTVIVTSQLTPALHGLIENRETLNSGLYEAHFNETDVKRTGDVPVTATTSTSWYWGKHHTSATTTQSTIDTFSKGKNKSDKRSIEQRREDAAVARKYGDLPPQYTRRTQQTTRKPLPSSTPNIFWRPEWDEEWSAELTTPKPVNDTESVRERINIVGLPDVPDVPPAKKNKRWDNLQQ